MTVSTTDNEVVYVSGGPAFPIPYRFLQNADIEAVLIKQDGTSETLTGAQYTLTGAGSQSGGTLTSSYAAGVLSTPGASLTISRDMDAVQPTDLRNQGKYLAETHENVFDRLTMLIQQGFSGLARALKRPVGKSYFDAEGRIISNVAEPLSDQDAATKGWTGRYFADLIDGATGLINTTTGILYDAGTLFDHLRFGVNRTVDSISALRLLSATRNQRAFVLGYYAKGDGGGGSYFVDPADTTTPDDGGSVIVAADGARWKLKIDGYVSVKQFGARGDGSPGDRPKIQAALNACLSVYAPPGIYNLTGTLIGRPRMKLWGDIAETTVFKRDGTNYGDTLVIGEETPDIATNANMVHISGIWFHREFIYTPGVTTSIPDPLSPGTAHIRMYGGQNVLIENCMIWNTPILVDIVTSSLVKFQKNGFHSMIYDNRNAALQEGFAAVLLRNSPLMPGATQLVEMIGNHINGGYFSPARSVTTGSVTTSMVECIGAQYGVYVTACEGLLIDGGYLGAFNQNNVYLNATDLITNVKIMGAFIDGSRDYAIAFNSSNGNPTVGVQIIGNDFNMQLINLGAIYALGAGWTTVTKLVIDGNNIENSIQTPILLFSAAGATINDNQISAYNVKRGGDANSLYAAGILVGGVSNRVYAMGNSYGGNVNDLSGGNGCRWGIYYDGVGFGYANDERDLGRSLGSGVPLVVGGMAHPESPNQAVHNAASGNYQILPEQSVYIRTGTATTSTIAGLPADPAIGQEILFKDNSNASSFPIVIQDTISSKTIDGASTISITTNNGFMKLRYNGTQWNRIG